MTERIKKTLMGIAALAALALGGGALAQAGSQDSGSGAQAPKAVDRDNGSEDGGEKGDRGGEGTAKGPGADKATAAALKITGGGEATAVERDTENGATWEVEVTKPDGNSVDVRLDQDLKLVVVEANGE